MSRMTEAANQIKNNKISYMTSPTTVMSPMKRRPIRLKIKKISYMTSPTNFTSDRGGQSD